MAVRACSTLLFACVSETGRSLAESRNGGGDRDVKKKKDMK